MHASNPAARDRAAVGARRPLVAIAGASGLIGAALTAALVDDYDVLALTRSPARARRAAPDARPRWRYCDLFSAPMVRDCLRGVDFAIYLVHSLAPSSRLTQARPRDLDLVLADNFAAAAAANGVRQILFVSTVLPEGYRVAPLLWSRREVEMVLAARGTPVTALRASLVVGAGGSGLRLLIELARRLPLLPLPTAARSLTRPIALVDLTRAARHCLGRPRDYVGAFDVGGADCLSYERMLRETASVLGLRRVFTVLPGLPIALVALVARWIGGAPPMLVGSIVESLAGDTRMRDNPVQRAIAAEALGFRAALTRALTPSHPPRPPPNPRAALAPLERLLMREQRLARSIQRLILPPGQDAAWVAGNYFRWLGRCCWPLVTTLPDAEGGWRVLTRWPRLCLLRLVHQAAESSAERQVYAVGGGLLARPGASGRPRLEFQTVLGARYTMAAIHDFAPALPWWLYRWTQAVAHLLVMRRYQRHLARLAS